MNAKELHDLYATLWEAVPETRPTKRLDYINGTWFLDENQERAESASIFVEDAAAICRVAAEDWLVCGGRANENPSREPFTIKFMAMLDGDYSVIREHWHWLDQDPTDPNGLIGGDGRRILTRGPTIHHALVAACLAVHNSAPSAAPPS